MVQQHGIELRSLDLPGLARFVLHVVDKIKRCRYTPVFADELDAALVHERRCLHLLQHANLAQRKITERQHRLPDSVPRKRFAVQHDHASAALCQAAGRRASSRTAADDNCIVGFIHSWGGRISTMFANSVPLLEMMLQRPYSVRRSVNCRALAIKSSDSTVK